MYLNFSFPLRKETVTADFQNRIKRINRFFQNNADLTGSFRPMGVYIYSPHSEFLPEDSPSTFLCFKFFRHVKNSYSEQHKLQIRYEIDMDQTLLPQLEKEVFKLSFVASLKIKNVKFSYDTKNLNIDVEIDDEDEAVFKTHMNILN